jgi:serine/threonine protein phosphatase PrpC
MGDSKLTFAKIVANPTILSWSQAYNAGKLFAVLSLSTLEEPEENDSLNILGKEILDCLEQEFFTLETKDLESIKSAILLTSQKIKDDIKCSFTICAVVNNILYIYILGDGKAVLKRDGKLGTLLEAHDEQAKNLKSASGFLQDHDQIVLETKPFSDVIPMHTLTEFLDNLPPQEAAENLAPIVHEKEEPGAAAIIISFTAIEKIKENQIEDIILNEEVEIDNEESIKENNDELNLDENPEFFNDKKENNTNLLNNLKSLKINSLNHTKKMILTIVLAILVVFILSVFFAFNNQQNNKTQTVFNSIYPQAQKKYDEGQSLLSLNQNLAKDSFNQAKTILENGKNQLPQSSKEAKQVLDLLTKINTALGTSANITASQAKEIDKSQSLILSSQIDNQALYFTKKDNGFIGVTQTEIFSLNQEGAGKKTLIKNDTNWSSPGGLAAYLTNIYVLDKKQNQIVKFMQNDSNFTNTNYFSETKPDFSKAVSMAIDSDVYILFSNGDISKYTKGAIQSYTISGLDKTFSNPTAIFTNADTTNVYVLDKGNSRIVVLDKNGVYKNQYVAPVIKSAKDFEVLEGSKKINILSSGKIYQIEIK